MRHRMLTAFSTIIKKTQVSTNSTIFLLETEPDTVDAPSAKEVQAELATYFVEEGELEWQYQHL